MTIVAACIPVLHPLYDRARTTLRKLRRGEQGITGRHPGAPGASPGGGTPDSPGFWSLKLRAIGLAESWWSSTAGRTSRRSGVRGQAGEDTRGPASGTAVSAIDGEVVVHSEDAGEQSEVERSRNLTVSVDGVFELADVERGRVSGHGPGQDDSVYTTIVGQK